MLQGYVGIVSRRGLCQLRVEKHDTIRLACQAGVTASKTPRVGFWAVLADDIAGTIVHLVDQGENKEALRLLNQTVKDGGHLSYVVK
jgi:hypothetical protein